MYTINPYAAVNPFGNVSPTGHISPTAEVSPTVKISLKEYNKVSSVGGLDYQNEAVRVTISKEAMELARRFK
jgi:hypothetical protein